MWQAGVDCLFPNAVLRVHCKQVLPCSQFQDSMLTGKRVNVEVHSLFRFLCVNGVVSVGINHHLVECTKCMYSDGNRSGYGAVFLIMVGDMFISSSNLDSQTCPLWMTFFYVFKLLWFDFPAVTDTCCRFLHHCHTEALSSSLWHSCPMSWLPFQCEHFIHKKGLSHLHCIYHVAFYPSSKIGSLSSCGSLVSLLMTVPSPVSFCIGDYDGFWLYRSIHHMHQIHQPALYHLPFWLLHIKCCHQ